MYAWETLNLYCRYDPRWFETSNRYLPGAEHLAVYRAHLPEEWRLRRRGLWFIADPPDTRVPEQGWKLHVSAAVGETTEVLHRTLPLLRDSRTPFKFLLDADSNEMTSGKGWPRGSSGKFLTVYPLDEERFRLIADQLTAALDGLSGPYILSDRRYRKSKSVYYRYGGFTGTPQIQLNGTAMLMIRRPDGALHPDVRQPYWSAPDWVTDPFFDEDEPADAGLAGGRFTVEAALTFSNQGGVYRGIEVPTGADVVIKEARPHVVIGKCGAAAIDVLAKEYRLLGALAETGSFVRPVAFFHDWEHAFLVEEHLEGQQLSQLSIATNPLVTLDLSGDALRDYFQRMRPLWRQVAEAIAAAHERGILLGDLSFTNVMVTGDDAVKIIDLEAAVEEGVDPQLGVYTLGISSPRTIETRTADRANDYHALGALMLGSIMVINNTVGYHRPALDRFLTELAADLALPAELVSLIRDLTYETATEPPDPELVLKRIDALPFAAAQRIPLARPPAPATDALRAEAEEVVAGVARYIRATADPRRDDRLFPADLSVFETNPLSVAFGAAGVLWALHRIDEVPDHLLAWALREDATSAAYPPGLYVGQAGIAWVLAELGQLDAATALLARARAHPLLWTSPDVLHGSAGYGLASLRMWQLTGSASDQAAGHLTAAREVGEKLAETCTRDSLGVRWSSAEGLNPEEKTRVGYAHGASGIALFLLYLHHATGEDTWYDLGRSALDFDLAQGTWINDHVRAYPRYALAGADTEEPAAGVYRNYWDEGTAGVTTVALRYLASRPDPELGRAVRENLRDANRKYSVFPQLFHGLAGLGNVLLDAWEFTGERRYLDEAWRTARGALLFRIDRPEGVVFPGEQALRESTDFATGSAGVGLFLHRLGQAGAGRRTNFNFTLDDLLPPGTVPLDPAGPPAETQAPPDQPQPGTTGRAELDGRQPA